MSYLADKRKEHEEACEQAIRCKDYARGRFHAAKTAEFSLKLAEVTEGKIARRYVDDAFDTLHRSHASIVGIPRSARVAVAGFLVEKELALLDKALSHPDTPSLLLIGGAKISGKSGKIWVIRNLLDKVDTILIGGKIAATFLGAKGFKVGDTKFWS